MFPYLQSIVSVKSVLKHVSKVVTILNQSKASICLEAHLTFHINFLCKCGDSGEQRC